MSAELMEDELQGDTVNSRVRHDGLESNAAEGGCEEDGR